MAGNASVTGNRHSATALTTRERLEMIRQDCKDDAAGLDGLPLTGVTMGRVLGEHLAIMDALAASMLKQEDRLDAIEATLDRAEAAAVRSGP